ncbi:hypothetical protein Y032_0093g2653 [Ancylostoma ceylanicum]|uniref:Uncharacterized protein n=1 Tax=Ancylostoma ceylanicum TaxID=53326 RepID=A0A016TLK7_9BILA|nr:hypothetical protein Y032_0093g2653 [Ancylostoma ceylanicum]
MSQDNKVEAPNGSTPRSILTCSTFGTEFRRRYCESRYAPILERKLARKYNYFRKLLHATLYPRDQRHLEKVTNEIVTTKDKIMELEEQLYFLTQRPYKEEQGMCDGKCVG